jgi:Spy/CpxP family protein refolding chaperone
MKSNTSQGLLAIALVGLGIGLAGAATTPTPSGTATTTSTPARPHWHARGSGMLGMTLRAGRELNLTPDQQQSIKSLLANARAQRRGAASAVDPAVLGNPGDPNYASAVQAAKAAAANRIDAEMALQAQVYDVLTPAQKQQLPQVLASIKAQMQARRATWHSGATGTPTG